MIITREDLIQRRASMKPNARGKRALDAMLVEVTSAELRFEQDIWAAAQASLALDPEYIASRG
ncbi:MAG: hypothetical protein WBA88_13480 [Pseudaminobacter sp.]